MKAALAEGELLKTTIITMLRSLIIFFGLLPLALGLGAGADLRAPLAVAVIGGLISATLLTLIVVPVIYATLEGLRGLARSDAPATATEAAP